MVHADRVAVLVGWIVEEEVHGAFSLPSEGGAPAVPCQSLGEADNPVSISVFQVKKGFDHLAAEAVADDAGSEDELGQWHSSAIDKGKVEIESLGRPRRGRPEGATVQASNGECRSALTVASSAHGWRHDGVRRR